MFCPPDSEEELLVFLLTSVVAEPSAHCSYMYCRTGVMLFVAGARKGRFRTIFRVELSRHQPGCDRFMGIKGVQSDRFNNAAMRRTGGMNGRH